uniref:Nucleotidyl transferase AbiEii/AbiGii toxin family protein n=1 Tax=Acidobacterium capsulatum TaxID=33075 RepID=A0A7V4XSL3_9BACT
MTGSRIKNVSASVRQRPLNYARTSKRPFAEVLQYFAMERFLYRLSVSPHSERFVLKGALLLTAWRASDSRPTMDIDLLGKMSNEVEAVLQLMREVAQIEIPHDGIAFDPDSFRGEAIREDADYSGVRVTFKGDLAGAKLHMQIDTGFGDVITPAPEELSYPTILAFPAPVLWGYSRETVIAEKLQALVQLRMLNSRMKDYYDLWLLSRHPELDVTTLRYAIQRTFRNRNTAIEAAPVGLSTEFCEDPGKQAQWRAFLRRSNLTESSKESLIKPLILGAARQ